MKKYFFLCAVLFCAAIPCRALDLILKNGETLYNITSVTPLFTRVHMVTHPPALLPRRSWPSTMSIESGSSTNLVNVRRSDRTP